MFNAAKAMLPAVAALLLPTLLWAGPVNVNTADAETLATELKGVGHATARAIVEHRRAHGPFTDAAALKEVKGVGSRILEINRGNILVSDQDEPAGKR